MIKPLKLITTALLFSTISIGASVATADDVILRLMPRHTDAHTQNFNPYNYGGPSAYVQDFAYEPLWIYNVLNSDKNFPALATSFKVADDLMSVTYKLREGVKWSDGKAFDADDVVFTYDYNKKHQDFPIGFDFYNAKAKTGNIVSIEKINAHEIKFNLKKPDALAHYAIGIVYPLPQHIWQGVKDPKNFANKANVATGPWTKIKNFSRSSFQMCRNPLYRGNKENAIDCLQFPQINGNEQVIAAVTVGDLDWAGDGMTDPHITYSPKSQYNKYWLPADGDTNLQINTTKAPFNNLEFRKAMSMAIDRKTILEISTFGLTTATNYPIGTGQFFNSWINEKALEPYKYLMKYDPKAAKAVLDKAGFIDKDGDGWRDNPDGSALEFDMRVPSGWTDWVNTVQTISENYQDIGLNAKMKTMEEGAWFDGYPTGDFDIYIMWTETHATPWFPYKEMFNPASMVPGKIREQAMHQMRIPAIESLLDDMAAAPDITVQKAKMTEIHKLVAQNLPVIGLFANPSWYQYSTRRFTGWVNKDNPYVRPMLHGGVHERVIHALSLKPVAKQ